MQKIQIQNTYGTVACWRSDCIDPEKGTLFFLHGLTADHTMFARQFPFFEKDWNILAWDAPAHGESRPYEPFTYANAAECLKQVLDACGIDKVILIGQSMGGFLSQSFIDRYPEYVKAFISIDSTPYGNYYSVSDQWWLRQVEWMAMLYPEKLLKSAMANLVCLTAYGRQNMHDMLACYSKKELCKLMGIGYAGFLEDNRVMTIPCPVLLLIGEKDRTGKVKAYNKEWAKRTGYPLIWIPGAAHNANVDNPDFVNQTIERFLAGIQ